jgi:hypothetical protein
MFKVTGLSIGLVVIATTGAASAHHSISRYYDRGQRVTLEGVLAAVMLRNPHSEMRLEVRAGEQSTRWTLELDDPGDMQEQGIGPDTLRAGDAVVVVGHPARDGSNTLFVESLRRPADGLEYFDD